MRPPSLGSKPNGVTLILPLGDSCIQALQVTLYNQQLQLIQLTIRIDTINNCIAKFNWNIYFPHMQLTSYHPALQVTSPICILPLRKRQLCQKIIMRDLLSEKPHYLSELENKSAGTAGIWQIHQSWRHSDMNDLRAITETIIWTKAAKIFLQI